MARGVAGRRDHANPEATDIDDLLVVHQDIDGAWGRQVVGREQAGRTTCGRPRGVVVSRLDRRGHLTRRVYPESLLTEGRGSACIDQHAHVLTAAPILAFERLCPIRSMVRALTDPADPSPLSTSATAEPPSSRYTCELGPLGEPSTRDGSAPDQRDVFGQPDHARPSWPACACCWDRTMRPIASSSTPSATLNAMRMYPSP